MTCPLWVEGPTEALPLPTVPDELTVGASGENLGLIVLCPLNWLNTGGVVYNVFKVELCSTFDCVLYWLDTGEVVCNVVKFELYGTFGFVGAGMSLIHMAIGGS